MHLQQTEIFRQAAGLPVADKQTIPSIEERKLNLSLLLEEAGELAEAYGLAGYFSELLVQSAGAYPTWEPNNEEGDPILGIELNGFDTNEYNPTEALDALADIQVILDGAVLTSGFQDVMPEALTEVFASNMSKVGLTENEAIKEGIRYGQKDGHYAIATPVPNHHCAYCIRRSTDGKLLKPSTFKAPNLSQFIQPE